MARTRFPKRPRPKPRTVLRLPDLDTTGSGLSLPERDVRVRVADDSLGTDSKIHGIRGRSLLKQFESLDYVYNPIK